MDFPDLNSYFFYQTIYEKKNIEDSDVDYI